MIRAESVTKRFPNGVLALSDVSLAVPRGRLVGVVGPSGSGKTTFFRLCNASIRPTDGHIEVLGVPTAKARGAQLRRLRRQVAMIYQNHNLVGSLSVFHNVLLGRLGRHNVAAALVNALLARHDTVESAYRVLDRLGIADKLYTRVEDLSGGQQQRVAVARALFQDPDLLLADEPVASVDNDTAIAILELLSGTCREQGTTVLISLHQAQYVERYCDQVVELKMGRLERSFAISPNGKHPRSLPATVPAAAEVPA